MSIVPKLTIAAAALLTNVAAAQPGEPGRDTLALISNAALVADWLQTRDIATDPAYTERNPILGATPSTGDVNLYFTAVLIGHNLIGRALPDAWARLYYTGVAVIEVRVVHHNYQIGIGLRF